MTAMTQDQMKDVSGGDFWSALGCGFGIGMLIAAPEFTAFQAGNIAILCLKTIADA